MLFKDSKWEKKKKVWNDMVDDERIVIFVWSIPYLDPLWTLHTDYFIW